MKSPEADPLPILRDEIEACSRCPRLVAWRTEVARVKRRAYRDWEYWGKPVPPFGEADAKLLVVGLAPAAHGGNRTGRMFTGDRSGDFLYRALHETGFASQAESVARGDGLRLAGAYITAVARCAPPDNKLTPREIRNCRPYLERELELLRHLKVVVALGRVALNGYLAALREQGVAFRRGDLVFGHNREFHIAPGQPILLTSYHPSQQNTSTGKLTAKMLRDVFRKARRIVDGAQFTRGASSVSFANTTR